MATNMYVKFSEDIKGESTFKEHLGKDGWCEITDLGQGFEQKASPSPASQGEMDTSKSTHSEISISKNMDQASLKLMRHCWKGTTLKKVEIHCFRAAPGDQPLNYFQIELEQVIIKEFDFKSSEGDLITEDLKLVADKATYCYRPMDKKGVPGSPYRAHFDLDNNVSGTGT